MKVLPLIFSILLSLCFTASLMMHNASFHFPMSQSYLFYKKNLRSIENKIHQKHFTAIPTNKKKDTKEPKINKETPPIKKKEDLPDCAKLDLSNPDLYEPIQRLFLTHFQPLFEKTSFSAEDFFEELFSKIQTEKIDHFSKISFDSPQKQKIYYELINGKADWIDGCVIQRYSLQKYFKIDSSHPKICFQCMNQEMIALFFTAEFAEKLWREKKDPLHRLSLRKKDLVIQLQKFHVLEPNWALFSFDHQYDSHSFLSQNNQHTLRRTYSSL